MAKGRGVSGWMGVGVGWWLVGDWVGRVGDESGGRSRRGMMGKRGGIGEVEGEKEEKGEW